jgi:pimeloyl-ACP methyl ester carboxylesterase
MNEIDYQILDVYEGNNLQNGVLQNIPAFLKVSFNIEEEVKYTFIAETPSGNNSGKISGEARQGFNHHWRIPILEEPGEWNIKVQLHQEGKKEKIYEEIPIHIPAKLFEYGIDNESAEEEDYLAALTIPTQEEIQYVDITSRFAELDAHWLQIDQVLKIWRYIYEDVESKLKEDRFIPILLIHGFNSNYTTWNWMVRYLWADGFRNIFAMSLYDDSKGVDKNTQHLEKVVNEILDICNSESLYLIGHSLGGLVGRHYVKTIDPRKIKLLITIGSPHLCGLSRIPRFVAFNIINRSAKLTQLELSMHPASSTAKLTQTVTEADLYVLSMVNICGTKFRGGDTGFKLKDNLVSDMINIGVNYIHTSLHRNEDTYNIIHNLIYGKSIIYKIRLLYINPIGNSHKKNKFYLELKPREAKDSQRFPFKGYIEVGAKKEPYIPQIPMIIFTSLREEENIRNEHLEIKIRDKKKRVLAKDDIIFALGEKEHISDLFSLNTKNGYVFQFAVYSYKLNYDFDD